MCFPSSVYRPSVSCPLSLLGYQEAKRTIAMSLLLLQVNNLLLSKHSMWQTGKAPATTWVCSLCGTGDKCTPPGDTGEISRLVRSLSLSPWASLPDAQGPLYSPHQLCKTWRVWEMRNQEVWQHQTLGCLMPYHQVTHIQDKIRSVCSTLLQGSVPRVSDPVSRIRSRLALLPKASSLCFVCPLPAVSPLWCTWSWMPHMCPYREGCNYLVDIG